MQEKTENYSGELQSEEEDQLIEMYASGSCFYARPDTPKLQRVLLNALLLETMNNKQQREYPSYHGKVDLFEDNYDKCSLFKWLVIYQPEQMSIYKKIKPSIIEEISLIQKMPRLKILALDKNSITNIEAVSFLACPKIQSLSLEDNHITNIQPLNKTNFPNLKQYSLQRNRVQKFHVNRINAAKIYQFGQSYKQYNDDKLFRTKIMFPVLCKIENSVLQFVGDLTWSGPSWKTNSKYRDRFPLIQ